LFLLLSITCGKMPSSQIANPEKRLSPSTVIDSLFKAYTNRDINLFKKLFPSDSSYKFYMSPAFFSTAQNRAYILIDIIDSTYTDVPSGLYLCWNIENEIRCHTRIFNLADSIKISIQPEIDTNNYVYHIAENGDTVGVEVLLLGGQIDIYYTYDGIQSYELIAIEKQVFYLTIDSSNKWIINKWFDFGTSN
jgi:hypothetical protein